MILIISRSDVFLLLLLRFIHIYSILFSDVKKRTRTFMKYILYVIVLKTVSRCARGGASTWHWATATVKFVAPLKRGSFNFAVLSILLLLIFFNVDT